MSNAGGDSKSPDPAGTVAEDPLSSLSFNDGYYKRFFRQVRLLGHGGFGGVYLCQHVLEGVELVREVVSDL